MDEQSIDNEPPALEVPGILLRLKKIEDIVMAMAVDTSRGPDAQLQACVIGHKLHIDRLLAIETRDIQQSLRHHGRAIARERAQRDGFGPDW